MRRAERALALGVAATLLGGSAAVASTPQAWNELDARSAKACIEASGLVRARVLPGVVRFDDASGVDARLVTGTWPQPHMKGRTARMLCLFDRRNGKAATADAAGWPIRAR